MESLVKFIGKVIIFFFFFFLLRILDLQSDRYFEALSAKFWNATMKNKCDSYDEDEGITLESLGLY